MKSILFAVLFLFVPKFCISQIIKPTRYNLDSLHRPTTKEDYKYIRVVENYKNQPDLFLFTEYYRSKTVSMKAISTNKDTPRFEGPRIDYYENGNKKQESNYVGNKLSGIQTDWYDNNAKKSEKELTWNPKTFDYNAKILQFWTPEGEQTVINSNGHYEYSDEKIHENGELKNGEKQGIWEGKNLEEKFSFTEIYNNGVFVSGISADENNNKYPYNELITKPTPANGMSDFYSYIRKNYRAPEVQGLKGKIYTTFVIEKDGSITNIKVIRDIGYGTGKEAIRIIANYGKWNPGKTRGIPTKATFSLPINIQYSNGNYSNLGPTYESEMIRNTNRN